VSSSILTARFGPAPSDLLLTRQIGFLFAVPFYSPAMLEAIQVYKSFCHAFTLK